MCGFHCCIILFRFLIFFRILRGLGPRCLYLFNCKSFSMRGSCVGWTHIFVLIFIFNFFLHVVCVVLFQRGFCSSFFHGLLFPWILPVATAVFSCSVLKCIAEASHNQDCSTYTWEWAQKFIDFHGKIFSNKRQIIL